MALRTLPLVALTLLIAGCTSEPAATSQEASAEPTAEPVTAPALNETYSWTLGVGASTPLVGFHAGALLGAQPSVEVDVPPGVATMRVTAEGSCTPEPGCMLELEVYNGQDRTTISGALPLTIEIDAPQPDAWRVALFPSGDASLVVEASGTFTVASV